MRSVTGERKKSSAGDNGGLDSLNFSIGTNQIQKVNQSASSSLSKPIHLSKTSLCKQNEKVALKESKKTNIVSNISSFIPLIQHKQAAAAGPGKIDVKVKALKAAEAAKRLEEKRQIERNLRKEALKLERAKLEENNLRLRELQKRTEDGHKKKDADKLAKKRLRENDERKEKEQKKMRIQQRHHQQRDLKVKVRSVKAKEENQQVEDEKTNIREFPIKSEQRQEVEVLRKTDAKSIPSEVVNKDKCSTTTSQPLETGEVICRAERSPPTEKLIVQRSTERSYDISPYQCSDDEDEGDDDNELPTKKHVPSWASKSSVAVHISLQLEMDADKIFPAESFCSIDEVLLPRIPRPKTYG